MNKKAAIQTILLIVITVFFIIFVKKHFTQIKDVIRIQPSFLILLIILNILDKIGLGFKNKKILGLFRVRLSFTEWFGASMVSNFYNYLAPKSGTAVIGVYLKNRHELNYHKYISVLITTALMTIFTSGITGFFVTLFFYSHHHIATASFLAMFLLMIMAPFALFLMPRFNLPKKMFFEKTNQFFEGWDIVRKNIKLLGLIFIIDFITVLIIASRYYILFRIFSQHINFAPCILISPFNLIMHFATIIPGGYGIKEIAVGAVSTMTNISFVSGVITTLSDRIITMSVTFVLGPFFSFVLLHKSFNTKKG